MREKPPVGLCEGKAVLTEPIDQPFWYKNTSLALYSGRIQVHSTERSLASYRVTGVAHQRQSNPRACWFTCLQMAVRYHYERCQQTLANLRSPEYIPKMQQRFKQGSNPSWAEWRAWAQECGFTAVNMTPAPLGVLQTLQRHGATLYSGTWGATYDGHVVVLIGVNTDTSKLYIDDPSYETRQPRRTLTLTLVHSPRGSGKTRFSCIKDSRHRAATRHA